MGTLEEFRVFQVNNGKEVVPSRSYRDHRRPQDPLWKEEGLKAFSGKRTAESFSWKYQRCRSPMDNKKPSRTVEHLKVFHGNSRYKTHIYTMDYRNNRNRRNERLFRGNGEDLLLLWIIKSSSFSRKEKLPQGLLQGIQIQGNEVFSGQCKTLFFRTMETLKIFFDEKPPNILSDIFKGLRGLLCPAADLVVFYCL